MKLKHLDEWNARREQQAYQYNQALQNIPALTLPYIADLSNSCWHLYVVRHPQRDALQEHLKSAGIGTLIHYPVPPHLSGAYRQAGLGTGTFPISEELAATSLSLPIGPHLEKKPQTAIIDALTGFPKSMTGLDKESR